MEKVLILLGIINQLATTRLNRALSELDLPMAQFSLLTHYSHNPQRGWTVTRLAEVMEVNQPAMTKTTQRLLKKGYLSVKQAQLDKRIKNYFVSKDGLETLSQAWEKLAPEMQALRSSWQESEIETLQVLLEKLKNQLDESRF